MTLTLEMLEDAVRKVRYAAPLPSAFGGLRVVVSHDLPRPLIGHRISPLLAHPLWAWWRRLWGDDGGWLAFWLATPMYGEPEVYRTGNLLIVPPAHFEALRAAS